MSPEQLHVLQHSLGVDRFGLGNQYRNRFVTDLKGPDGRLCLSLCKLGLMMDCGPQRLCGGMHCFVVTEAGKAAMARVHGRRRFRPRSSVTRIF